MKHFFQKPFYLAMILYITFYSADRKIIRSFFNMVDQKYFIIGSLKNSFQLDNLLLVMPCKDLKLLLKWKKPPSSLFLK